MARKLYVNVYSVGRCYGGPEEGGWYYDCGDPTASHPVKRMKQAERLQRRLEARCPEHIPGRRGPRCLVLIERTPGAYFPKHQPYYE
jgi:hypothetical protein